MAGLSMVELSMVELSMVEVRAHGRAR